MDNGQNSSDTYMKDGPLVLHHDEKEAVGSADDVLVRRLKNRERQRRYRARKRQEADLRKTSNIDQSTSLYYQQTPNELQSVPVEVQISVNVTSHDYLTRVHCKRDWKKDARRAHLQKKREMSPIDPCNSGGSSATFLQSSINADLQSNQSSTSSSKRHWKAEARNKRTSD